jgi:hypothetical protein
MEKEIVKNVVLPGSARDTLKRMYADDITSMDGKFDTLEQQDRILSGFIEKDMPEDPVQRKAYFADIVRNQIATIQGSKASSGIQELENWWNDKSGTPWNQVINSDLVLKVDDCTHVRLCHATAMDLEEICKRREAEAESKTQKAVKLREMFNYFRSILGVTKTFSELSQTQIELSMEVA